MCLVFIVDSFVAFFLKIKVFALRHVIKKIHVDGDLNVTTLNGFEKIFINWFRG